ncbi:MAG: hypothetical protein ABW123_24250 [Cystobacter sp.]
MDSRPTGPYRYVGHPDVDGFNCFKDGYGECLNGLGVEEGSDVLFGVWLREVKGAWPTEGWEPAYLRETGGDQTRALRKYLDHVAEFRTLTSETLASIPWTDPGALQFATRIANLTPTRVPPSTLDFLLEVRRDGRLGLFIGPLEVKRMAGLIAGYRLCLGLVGARDEEYVRFERWLHEEKGLPEGHEWPQSFLDACGGDPERAIRRLLDAAAEFRAS